MKTINIEKYAYELLIDGCEQLATEPEKMASVAISTYYKILALPEAESAAILAIIRKYD